MGRLAEPLRDAGADVPDTYSQLLPATHPLSDQGFFALTEENDPGTAADDAAEALVHPAPCSAWFGVEPPPVELFDATELLRGWILVESSHPAPQTVPGADDWYGQPEGAQETWVRTTFDALRACRLEQIALPWSSGGP